MSNRPFASRLQRMTCKIGIEKIREAVAVALGVFVVTVKVKKRSGMAILKIREAIL